mmetsp:Transcript_2112/g.3098  ORF Transcript_2112/g.3098 Transcript_2112/m.3098 type:complete len:1125 (-) Transcript_2112:123-3497(-)|eukprot:CAMPEP_0194120386 /NCGR_PEP_ID=MMETSP0150-20130528/43295_1 /TAXON_ID=122233 /ORGANISM="Chaetoceros debilis, Strain MM31A-1" /LENGTH=1124 /DNA_ID=CAMNT_0038812487 /DNA_START=153 /DNA_END=3527 /DNA_ORIENTATION=+
MSVTTTQKGQQQEIGIQQQLKQLRRKLQGCKEVDADSEAMAFALRTIQQVEDSYKNGSRKITRTSTNSTSANNTSRNGEGDNTTNDDAINNSKLSNANANANGHTHEHDGGKERHPLKSSQKKKTTMLSKLKSILFTLIQFIFLELPLVSLFALLVFTTSFSHLYDQYLNPQLDLMTYTDHNRTMDQTYYHRICTHEDMTAHTPDELMITDDFTTQDCLEHMMVHGMSMYPQILQSSTASNLRDWILERNTQIAPEDEIDVIANEHRWSFYIGANEHPSVTKALHEITHHPVFRQALEQIVGPNPAIIEMTAITSEYGAADQFWHPDVIPQGSAAKYAQSFVPSYALFVALQDITDMMGATEVCPGTYMCGEEADVCDGHGFQVSGHSKMGEYWHSGDAIFMNQQSYHRGPAHKDPKKGKRSLFIITFSPRPESMDVETRLLGQGGSYSLRKDMWGHTLEDFENASDRMKWPWTILRGLGLWKDNGVSNLMGKKSSSAQWGWDWITQNSMRIANTDTGYFQNQLMDFASDGHYYKYLNIHFPNVFKSEFSLNFKLGGLANLLQMAPKVDEDMEWREYMEGTVEIWKKKVMQVNIVVHAVILMITVLVCVSLLSVQKMERGRDNGNGPKSELDSVSDSISVSPIKGAFKSIRRVAVLDGILILVALLLLQRTADSKWANEITSRTLYGSPFRVPSETLALAEDILNDNGNGNDNGDVMNRDHAVISLADVLISERFNVRYLNMNGVNWLDFHEGNMKLRSKVKGVGASAMMGSTGTATNYSPHLTSKDKQRLILSILDGTEREGSRFLKQNSYGDWIVAPQDYAYRYVSKLVHLESRALLAALEEEGRYISGAYKHGRTLNGITLRVQSMKHIYGIMEALFEDAGISMSDLNLMDHTHDDDDDDQVKVVKQTKLKVARSHVFGLKQMTTPIKSKSSIHSLLLPRRIPSLSAGVMFSTELMGMLGDTVEVQYGGMHNEYYKGKIVKITEGSQIDIQYIDGEIDSGLAPKHLRKFEPYAKGEQVQCRTKYQELYRNCIIDKVLPNDIAYIILEGQRSRTKLAEKFIRRYIPDETFQVGDAVNSPFQGSEEVFKGTITAENKDGTYNILFEDGDWEHYVPAFELEHLD